MNKKVMYRHHIMMMLLSSVIFGFACIFFIRGNFGSDAMTTFLQGLYSIFEVDISIGNYILSGLFVFIALMFDRSQLGMGTVVYIIVSSISLYLANICIPIFKFLPYRVISFIIGVLLMSLGIAIGSYCDCGKNCYDAMVFSIIKRLNSKYNKVRMICDAFMLILGIIMGATFGIGTILSVLLIGNTASFMINFVGNLECYKEYMNI